ncbi:MAG: choice-of-anchor tandem repeat NxxGxxAF-containing protein [Chthoniobacteraceae bacterium]
MKFLLIVAAAVASMWIPRASGEPLEFGPVTWGQPRFDIRDFDQPIIKIAAGYAHTLSIKQDGALTVRGANIYGQANVPPDLGPVSAAAAGWLHTVALRGDGTVVAWGYNADGQTTVPTGLANVVGVAAGRRHTLALRQDGTVAGWGFNDRGQATPPAGLNNVIAVTAGDAYSLALKEDGTLVAWGSIALPPGVSGVSSIAGGARHIVALMNDGTVQAWGEYEAGQTQVPFDLSGVIAIAAGESHSVALTSNGRVVAWGGSVHGEQDVPSGLRGVVAIAAGGRSTLALRSNGKIVAWGYNGYGETLNADETGGTVQAAAGEHFELALKRNGTVVGWGLNNRGQVSIPEGLSNAIAIAAGQEHSVALRSDGTVAAWGANDNGQSTVPDTARAIVKIAAGGAHSLALKADGTVVAWGENTLGQSSIPSGLSGVREISAGIEHSVALKSDGTVVVWGSNQYGQKSVPAGLSGVVKIAAGGYHTLALKGDGTVVGWGLPDVAEVPAGLTGISAVAAGTYHSLVLKLDGSVASWGRNYSGEATVPTGLTGAIAIAAGSVQSIALVPSPAFAFTEPQIALLFAQGQPMPGAGVSGSGVPAGALLLSFGSPTVCDSGKAACLVRWTSSKGGGASIVKSGESLPVATVGANVPGQPDLTFANLKDPVLSPSGRIAFLATIAGSGVAAGSNSALVSDALDGQLRVLARTGEPAPQANGAVFAKLHTATAQNGVVALYAQLKSGTGEPKAKAGSDFGLWEWSNTSAFSGARMLLREGDPLSVDGIVNAKTIGTLAVFNVVSGSTGQGGSAVADGLNPGAVYAAQATFTDKTSGFFIGSNASGLSLAPGRITGQAADGFPGAPLASEIYYKSFGTVRASGDGTGYAFLAKLSGTGVIAANEAAVFSGDANGIALRLRKSDRAPGTASGTVATLLPPVPGPAGGFVVQGTIKGSGIKATNDACVWWWNEEDWTLLAREGDAPPDVAPTAKWKAFTDVALPAGPDTGPLLSASLATGAGGVKGADDSGLWGVGSGGTLRLLLRENQEFHFGPQTTRLKKFTALKAVAGSAGVARSFSQTRQVVVLATFSDNSQGILAVTIP